MIITRIPLPVDRRSQYYEYSGLNDSDLAQLRKIPDLVEVRYYYGSGEFEGMGQMLLRQASGEWRLYSLSHCSCYGPMDHLEECWDSLKPYKTLEGMKADCSQELWEELKPLVW